jgi:hypothetical protein
VSEGEFIARGQWEERVEETFPDMQTAIAECEKLLREHPKAYFNIVGPGRVVNIYRTEEREQS